MTTVLISLSVLQFAFVAGFAVKKQKLIQATPSLVWFALMTLPFIFERSFFLIGPRTSQSLGLFIVCSALAIGDFLALKLKSSDSPHAINSNTSRNWILYLLCAFVVIIPIVNYTISNSIPILKVFFGGLDPNQVSLDRENYAKLMQVPYALKILFNWVPGILGPICIIWFISIQRRVTASLLLIWVAFYSLSSSAIGPLIIFFWTLLFVVVYKFNQIKNLGNFLTVGLATALLFVIGSGVWLGNTAINLQGECGVKVQSGFTPGDVMRSCSAENAIRINPVVDRIGYRFFLTPVEVSNHWYDFYDGDPSQKRVFLDIFERENSKQASNKVGNWAYTDRFPSHYGKSISANGSIDADAYSLGGFFAIFLSALIILVIRVFISFPVAGEAGFSKILEAIALSQLAFFPNTAPLQAILLPQGLGLVLFLLFILRRKGLMTAFKSIFR